MEPGVLHKVKTEELNEILETSFLGLSLFYARAYTENPQSFISSFKKFPSIRMACAWIVQTCKHGGSFEDCKKTGKDFTEWASKQDVGDKRVLAEILLILYSIIHG